MSLAKINLKLLRQEVEASLYDRSECHGYNHALMTERLALDILRRGFPELAYGSQPHHTRTSAFISAIALLHDVWDYKFVGDYKELHAQYRGILTDIGFDGEEIDSIFNDIDNISYSKGKVPKSLSGKIVQDADRLLATGATGICRVMSYGSIVKPSFEASLEHLTKKCLTDNRPFNTPIGKALSLERNQVLEKFIEIYNREQVWGLDPRLDSK